MAQEEARRLLEDVDRILSLGAREPHERERLLELRRRLEQVERTGRFPEDAWATPSMV